MKILGIDEAGRGAVLGPLVVCGYMIDEKKLEKLKEWKVRDSKLVTPRMRSYFYKKLKPFADGLEIFKLAAAQIDRMRTEENLNRIEIRHMHKIIDKIKPDKVYVDSVEANTEKFRRKILDNLHKEIREKLSDDKNFICENKADVKYPIVGAASIIAKVVRDAEIEKLHKKHGHFGSGYTSDPRTIDFIKKWLEKYGKLPDFCRSSWITAKMLKKDHEQRRLGDFFE